MRGKKVEPVQTDFTDDVISESNAANEEAQGKGKREREQRERERERREQGSGGRKKAIRKK